jgi:hypothetical protein
VPDILFALRDRGVSTLPKRRSSSRKAFGKNERNRFLSSSGSSEFHKARSGCTRVCQLPVSGCALCSNERICAKATTTGTVL